MKKQIEIKVMGQKFMVRSESSEEYINAVADFVDQKITEIVKGSKSVASLNVAILAAMNIADEFMKYKDQKDKQVSKVEEKIKTVIELIDLQG
ncbi:MAG: cell division protein ZapA [Deltaproteobacteria bacterium]|nr:cell division protein ZapA [Deltaproteobacteria bacterium]